MSGKIKRKKKSKLQSLKSRSPKARWYQIVKLWDQPAQKILEVESEPVIVQGMIPPLNEVPVCLVPTSIMAEQGMALQKLLEGHFRAPVLVLTNNIQLAKLKPISESEAQTLMEQQNRDQVIVWEKPKEQETAPEKSDLEAPQAN